MATKKKHHKKSPARSARRRSMGAIGSKAGFQNALPMIGGLLVGAIGATAIDKATARFNVPAKLVGPIKLVAGMYMTGSNKPLFRGLGYGIASSGAIQAAAGFGLLQGLSNRIAGIMEDQYVSGMPGNEPVSGIDTDAYVSGINPMEPLAPEKGSHQWPYNDPYNPGTLGLNPNVMSLG
jgi:hypothetical protein